jgi:hypothetical protein
MQAEATLLRNLFSPLVDYDLNGQLVVALADRFWWEDDKLIFSFSSKSKTNKGNTITADDAAVSLKRLIKDGKNKHGDIGMMLCPDLDRSLVMAHCPGITVKDDLLILKPAKVEYKEYLLPILASVDFRIIPKAALDDNLSEIISFSETSGPYYVASTNSDYIELRANKFSYLYNDKMPSSVNLIFVKGSEVFDLFKAKQIDLLPTLISINQQELEDLERFFGPEIEIFKTYNLKISAIFFSQKAISDFTVDERFFISSSLIEVLNKARCKFNVDTLEYFQDFSEGNLTNEQLKIIENLRNTSKKVNFKRKPKIAVSKAFESRWSGFFEKYPMFEKEVIETSAVQIPMERRMDVYPLTVDVAFNSSPSLLSYALKEGFFGPYGAKTDIWFKNYVDSVKKDRLVKLNDLHFNALKNCFLYPVTKAPYIAISRKPWSIHINKFFAATNLWQIQMN